MGVHKKGGLVGGFDQLRAPDAPTISVSAGNESVTVTITNPTDTGGGDITSYAVSALTGPIEDTTFAVTVVSDSGNKYAIDGTTQGTVTLHKGHTYIFDQSDSSNSSHPLRLSTTSNGSHGGGSEYTTGVTTSGTPGSAGAFTKIVVDSGAASTLYYYCSSHSGMGGTANVKTSLQGGASGSSSPVTVSSLTNGEDYNVRASAINAFGQSPYSAATSSSPSVGFDRGVFIGGINSTGSYPNNVTMDSVQISSTGNASDFGDYGQRVAYIATASSTTRGLGGGGRLDASGYLDVIEYITLASAGNGTDFGDLQQAKQRVGGGSNTTKAVFYGGLNSSSVGVNEIDTVTIASTGNATDFNDMATARYSHNTFSSSTRGISFGGYTYNSGALLNEIEFSVFASSGSATDFGDLTQTVGLTTGLSSATRGVRAGGHVSGVGKTDTMDYVTMASAGNATDFGNLAANTNQAGATSNATRGIIGGGDTGSNLDVIQYITIASTGDTTDFGDLTVARKATEGLSGSHGGLQ